MSSTAEYHTMRQCTYLLIEAIERCNRYALSDELLAAGLISWRYHFAPWAYTPSITRPDVPEMVKSVTHKVWHDPRNYDKFIEVLKKREADHKFILKFLDEEYKKALKRYPTHTSGLRTSEQLAGDVILGKHDVAAVVNELSDVASKWILVGTCLGVDQTDIAEIESLHLAPREALLKVVAKWLDTARAAGPRTWNSVVDALRQPMLKEERVADQIERNICSTFRSRAVSSPPEIKDTLKLRLRKISRSESSPAHVEDFTDGLAVPISSEISVQIGVSLPSRVPFKDGQSTQHQLSSLPTHVVVTSVAASTSTVVSDSKSGASQQPIEDAGIDRFTQTGVRDTTSTTKCVQTQTTSTLSSSGVSHDREGDDVSSFVQACLKSLPKISKESPSPNFLDSLPSTESSSTHSESTCPMHSESEPIKLECEVFNGASGRQIQCTSVTKKETRELYRDIKLKVKKFNTVPPCTPIFLRVRASEPCYVYIINKGSSGNLTTLIPNECDKNNRLQDPKQFIQFPSANAEYEFELDRNCGTETIIVLAYSGALSDSAQAERDCEDILSVEKKELLRDIKMVKKPPKPCVCRGCIEVQFTVK